jgi:hypothetical protein
MKAPVRRICFRKSFEKQPKEKVKKVIQTLYFIEKRFPQNFDAITHENLSELVDQQLELNLI